MGLLPMGRVADSRGDLRYLLAPFVRRMVAAVVYGARDEWQRGFDKSSDI